MRAAIFALTAVSLTVCGCAAIQEQAAVQRASSCLLTLYNSPEGEPFRAHQPFDVSNATLSQLGDTSLASTAEVAALPNFQTRLRACENGFLTTLASVAPTIEPIFEQSYSETDNDLLALSQRRMSWGELTRRRRDRALAGRMALIAESRRLNAENQMRQATALQGLAVSAALLDAGRPTFPPPANMGAVYCVNCSQ